MRNKRGVGPRRSLALCVGALRSLCRCPALFVSGPGALVLARCSLCRAPAVSVSGPALSCSGPGALSLMSGPGALCVGPALSISGVCVGARRSLCRSPALPGAMCRAGALSVSSVSGLALFVSGPGTLCVRPGILCVRARCFLALCIGARAVCRVQGLAPFVSDPGSLCGPSPLCVGAWRSLCRAPALSVKARRSLLCVGHRGVLCRHSLWDLVRGPPSSDPCADPGSDSSSDPRATQPVMRLQLRDQFRFACPSSDPRATNPALSGFARECHTSALRAPVPILSSDHPSSNPRATQPILRIAGPRATHALCGPSSHRVPPIRSAGSQLRSACHPSCPARSILFGGLVLKL